MKVAAIQMVSAIARRGEPRRAPAALLEQAAHAGAELAVLPEYFCLMGRSDTRQARGRARRPATAPSSASLPRTARELGCGSSAAPCRCAAARRARRNTPAWSSRRPASAWPATTRSISSRSTTARERYDECRTSSSAARAALRVCARTRARWRIGLSVCYDLRFPELYRALISRADVLLRAQRLHPRRPATRTGKCCCARARVENLAYVVAPAQGGVHENGRRTWGHSMVVDPWGEVVAMLPEGEGIVAGEVRRERIAEVRTQLPALEHRRRL